MGEISEGRYLTRQDLEVVIRRATEIETHVGVAVPELSEADVLHIASEVGLSEASIRHALAEHYAGSGSDTLLVDRGLLSRLYGSALVNVNRLIARPAGELQAEVEKHFRTSESLRPVRRRKRESLWEPETGLVVEVARAVDFFGRGYALAKNARAVELRVVALDEERSQVSLTADLANKRTGWFWWLGVAAGGSVAVAGSVLAIQIDIPALAVVATPAALAVSLWLARFGFQRAVDKMRLSLDGLVDRLEQRESLEPERTSLLDLLK